MRDGNSGPIVAPFAPMFWRTNTNATHGDFNQYTSGGTDAGSNRSMAFRRSGDTLRIRRIWVAAFRTDGSVNTPPALAAGCRFLFRLYSSSNYILGPDYTVIWEHELAGAQLPTGEWVHTDLTIPGDRDFAITAAILDVAPGGTSNSMAMPIVEAYE
jgi:hypothetical protein